MEHTVLCITVTYLQYELSCLLSGKNANCIFSKGLIIGNFNYTCMWHFVISVCTVQYHVQHWTIWIPILLTGLLQWWSSVHRIIQQIFCRAFTVDLSCDHVMHHLLRCVHLAALPVVYQWLQPSMCKKCTTDLFMKIQNRQIKIITRLRVTVLQLYVL